MKEIIHNPSPLRGASFNTKGSSGKKNGEKTAASLLSYERR